MFSQEFLVVYILLLRFFFKLTARFLHVCLPDLAFADCLLNTVDCCQDKGHMIR